MRKDSGIRTTQDMRGKPVGVLEFQQTAAVWSCGTLKHGFGVNQIEIEFFMERLPETSHGGATGFKIPDGVKLNQIPVEKNIGQMLLDDELDATLLYLNIPNLVDQSSVDLANHSNFGPLFSEPEAESLRYYKKN